MKNIAFIFVFFSFMISLKAQDSWQRKYPNVLPDTSVVQIAAETNRVGRSLMISVGRSDNGSQQTMYITLLDLFGSESWTVEVFSETLEGVEIEDATIYDNINDDEGYYFSFVTRSFSDFQKYLGKISRDGSEVDIVKLNYNDSPVFVIDALMTSSTARNAVVYFLENKIGVSRLENHDTPLWNSLYATNENLRPTFVTENADSTLLISGLVNDVNPFTMSIDTNGTVLFGKKYLMSLATASFTKTLRWNDKSGYIMLTIGAGQTRFMALDSIGDVIWSRFFNPSSTIENVDFVLRDDRIIAGGQMIINDTLKHITFDIDKNGNVDNATDYKSDVATDSSLGLFLTEKGYNLISNNTLDNETVPVIYAHDENNATLCSNFIEMDSLEVSETMSDTLILTKEATLVTTDTTDYVLRSKSVWNIPKLNVKAEPERFCPNEEVMSDITASVTVAPPSTVSYSWNTGETTPMIVGTETDNPYVVTATIDYQECFILKDTTILKRYEVPMPEVNIARITNCKYELIGVPRGGKPDYQYQWSTGETAQSITVEEEGTYTLTVTDDCGSEGMVAVDVIFPVLDVEIIEIADNSDCTNFGLIAQVTNAEGVPSISWSNGGQDISIENLDSGTYTVTVMDDCGMSASDSYNLTTQEPITGYNLNENLDCDAETVSVEVSSIEGGNAAVVDFSLLSNPAGSGGDFYSGDIVDLIFTLEDFCGNTYMDTLKYSAQCNNCLKYPIAFFPQGQEERERTFGPVDLCDTPEEYTDFEFKIYNRWGQEVFSTDSFGSEWNGIFNNEQAPQEVYTYYARYTLLSSGEEQVDKGNVTLIR